MPSSGRLTRGVVFSTLLTILIISIGAVWPNAARAAQPRRTITYGGDEAFHPLEYLDASGRACGFQVEIIQAIGREMGVDVDVRLGPWSEIHDRFKAGNIDVVGMFDQPERRVYADFATPHIVAYSEIFIRKGDQQFATLADLAGKRVIVQAGALAEQVLQARANPPTIITAPTESAALQLLASGQGDAAVVTSVGGHWAMRTLRLTSITTTGSPTLESPVGLAVAKGNTELLASLNEGIRRIKDNGTYDQIYQRWLAPEPPNPARYRLVVALSIAAGLLLAGIIAMSMWSRMLRARAEQARIEATAQQAARQQAEADNERLSHQIERAQSLTSVGRLASTTSHDFNNLLMAIRGTAEILQQPMTEAERAIHLRNIEAATDKGAELSRRLSNLVKDKAEDSTPKRACLVTTVREALPLIDRLAGRTIKIAVVPEAMHAIVGVDRHTLEHALLNLVVNARDAMPGGGTITITTRRDATSAIMMVADNGQGMDEQTLARCKESFFTTKPHGTGLGLASVDAVVKSVNGTLSIESAPGEGTRVTLTMPLLVT